MKLLLTGAPRSGKSTLVRRLLEAFPGNAGGMLVSELLGPNGRRCGFELQVAWRSAGGPLAVAERAVLAHEDLESGLRLGRYGISEAALALAVRALDAAMHEGGLVVIDEVGPLQLASPAFSDAVLRCLDSPNHLLATLAQFEDPFVARLKARPGVRVVEVNRHNRQPLSEGLAVWVRGQHRI